MQNGHSQQSLFSSLPADVLAKCLDTWAPEHELIWQRPRQRGQLRLVCKRWSRVLERGDDTFAVLSDHRQINKLLARLEAKPERASRLAQVCARFPKRDAKGITAFMTAFTRLLTVANKVINLILLLFDDTIEIEEGRFERLLTAIEGLRSLQTLAIMPTEYRSYRPIIAIPMRSFVAFCAQPELRRIDIIYLPAGRDIPQDEGPSEKLQVVHTAASGMGRQALAHGSQPDNRPIEEWLFDPALLARKTSCGIIDIEPFLTYAKSPGMFDNLRSLRLEYADLPRLADNEIKLPALKSLHLDGLREDHNFMALTRYDLDLVEFWHECDEDTDVPKSGRNISLKQQFYDDVLDSLKGLPTGKYPFKLFVLRCAAFCGPLDHLGEAARLCRDHGAHFERRRGMEMGWALI